MSYSYDNGYWRNFRGYSLVKRTRYSFRVLAWLFYW